MILTDEELDALTFRARDGGGASLDWAISEAVRLTAERCAQICESQGRQTWTLDGKSFHIATNQCAAAIRKRIKLPAPSAPEQA